MRRRNLPEVRRCASGELPVTTPPNQRGPSALWFVFRDGEWPLLAAFTDEEEARQAAQNEQAALGQLCIHEDYRPGSASGQSFRR